MIASNQQQYTETEQLLAPVLQSAQEIGDRRILVGAYAELGLIASYRGEFELALTYLAQERRLADELGVPYQVASSLSNTGDLRLKVGDFVGARQCYEEALSIFRQSGIRQAESNVVAFMGWLACLEERFGDGRSLCEQALQLAQQANDPLRVYLVCYEVLAGMEDEGAKEVLANGQAFLKKRVALIEDPTLRQSLLENISTHRKFQLLGTGE
jgi:tetratricopeptide (TPR) repeat protein